MGWLTHQSVQTKVPLRQQQMQSIPHCTHTGRLTRAHTHADMQPLQQVLTCTHFFLPAPSPHLPLTPSTTPASYLKQPLRRVKLLHFPALQHKYPVGIYNAVQPVRNSQHSTVSKGSSDSLLYECIAGSVHIAGSFIQHQHPGLAQQRPRHAQQLSLP